MEDSPEGSRESSKGSSEESYGESGDKTIRSSKARFSFLKKRKESLPSASDKNQSRVVQFGIIRKSLTPNEPVDYDPETINDENINERLRHEAPVLQPVVEIKRFSQVMANVCTILLQNCHREACIVRETSNRFNVSVNLDYVSLSENYDYVEHDIELILRQDDSSLKYRKLKKDLSWLENVLRCTIVNLQRDSYFDKLLKILKNVELTKEEEKMLLGAKKFNNKELAKLKFYLESERADWMEMIHDITQKLGDFNYELNWNMSENIVKIKYLKEWQQARLEQNKMILQKKEVNIKESTEYMSIQAEKEEYLHNEMVLFLIESIREYTEQIESWMDRYDKDLEEKEQDVEDLKIQLEHQADKYEALLQKYNERQRQIDEFKAYKLRRKREIEEEERRNHAAIIIQTWWRDVMLKKKLGPFKRKKKGRKNSSKKRSFRKGGGVKNLFKTKRK